MLRETEVFTPSSPPPPTSFLLNAPPICLKPFLEGPALGREILIRSTC